VVSGKLIVSGGGTAETVQKLTCSNVSIVLNCLGAFEINGDFVVFVRFLEH
jgi:hypothetical protein